jgi:peroxiredoxin
VCMRSISVSNSAVTGPDSFSLTSWIINSADSRGVAVSVLISVRSVVVGMCVKRFRKRVFKVGEFILLTISGSFPISQLESKGMGT